MNDQYARYYDGIEEDEGERCTRCGDQITDTNRSDRVSDDLCRDCRYEVDSDKED